MSISKSKMYQMLYYSKTLYIARKIKNKKDEKSISPQLAVHMYCWRIFMSLPCKGAVTMLHNSTFHCVETNFMLSYQLMIHHWIQDQIYNICAYIHVLRLFWKRNFSVFKTTLTSHYVESFGISDWYLIFPKYFITIISDNFCCFFFSITENKKWIRISIWLGLVATNPNPFFY